MAGSIRLLFEPQEWLERDRRMVLGGTLRLTSHGSGRTRAKLDEPQDAELTFHLAHLERARGASPQFEPFAKVAGQIALRGADRKPHFIFQPGSQIEYLSESPQNGAPPARLMIRYAASDFGQAPTIDSPLCQLRLPALPAEARYLELGVELAIGGDTEASVDHNERLDVPLDLHLSLYDVTPYFAPGSEIFGEGQQSMPGERCRIAYRVVDAIRQISSAWFEISRKRAPGEILARIPLEPNGWTPGEHVIEWDGMCTEGNWAGKFVTVLGSPYEIRLVAETPFGQKIARAQTEVLVEELQLTRGSYVNPDADPPEAGSDAHYQLRLTQLGFHTGPIDGQVGTKTKRAIKDFQRYHAGLKPTGNLDGPTKSYLDEEVLPGTGLDHYQFILNRIGYRAGFIDGLNGPKTRRAVRLYREDRGLGAGDTLDGPTKAALDAESLPPLERRVILEGDDAVADVHDNPLPAPGTRKKLFTYCDGSISPGSLPYRQKFGVERDNLVRAHLPLQVKALVRRSDGTSAFSPEAVQGVKISFKVDTSPPAADLGIPNKVTREFVASVMAKDGDEARTGHHAHEKRGGVRKGDDPGTYLPGQALAPYEADKNDVAYQVTCFGDAGAAFGTAGIYLVPSTIAGDHLTVVAEVAADGFDRPSWVRATTGTLVNYRRYHITSLWFMEYVSRPHRTEREPELGLRPWYQPAFVEFIEPERPRVTMVRPRAGDPRVIDLALYTAILREANYSPAQLSDAAIKTRFDNRILWPLRSASVYNQANEQAYYDAVDSEIMAFEERFSTTLRNLSLLEGQDGITVLVFDKNAPDAGTFGIHPISNPKLQRWAWSLLASTGIIHLIHDQDTSSAKAIDGETMAHEMGHALWLHHASTEAGKLPYSSDRSEHNPPEYETCTMSYVSLAHFCGKCVLKLRGWDEAKL